MSVMQQRLAKICAVNLNRKVATSVDLHNILLKIPAVYGFFEVFHWFSIEMSVTFKNNSKYRKQRETLNFHRVEH